MGAAAEVREGAAETLFRASQVLGAKLPNDQRPTMRILGICRWGWGTGSVGSEPPERCLRPAQGSKTIDPSGAIIAICSVPVRARKSPCDTPRYWARYWAQVIAKRGKTYTGVSVRDGARRRLVFSARIGTPETVEIIRFPGFCFGSFRLSVPSRFPPNASFVGLGFLNRPVSQVSRVRAGIQESL